MREKLVFKKLKMTDHLCLQTKKVKNRHNQDEKLPFSLKVGNSWRLLISPLRKSMFCIAGFQDGRQKQKHFPPLITILFFHASTGEKKFS